MLLNAVQFDTDVKVKLLIWKEEKKLCVFLGLTLFKELKASLWFVFVW